MREKSVTLICAVGLMAAAALMAVGCATSTSDAPNNVPRVYTARFEVGAASTRATARNIDTPWDWGGVMADAGDLRWAVKSVAELDAAGAPTNRFYRIRLGNESYGGKALEGSGTIDGVSGHVYERGLGLYVANESDSCDALYGCNGRVVSASAPVYQLGAGGAWVETEDTYRPAPALLHVIEGEGDPLWTYPGDNDTDGWVFAFSDYIPVGGGGPDADHTASEGANEEYLGFRMVFPEATIPSGAENAGMLSFVFELRWSDTQGNSF